MRGATEYLYTRFVEDSGSPPHVVEATVAASVGHPHLPTLLFIVTRCPVLLLDFPVSRTRSFDRDVAHSCVPCSTMPVPGSSRDSNSTSLLSFDPTSCSVFTSPSK